MRQGQHMGNRCKPLWQRIPQPLPQLDQRQEMPLGAAVWQVIDVPAGATLKLGATTADGARAYVLFRGGLDCPKYLTSCSTFTLGQFGGHGGRALRAGDVLALADADPASPTTLPADLKPAIGKHIARTVDQAVLTDPARTNDKKQNTRVFFLEIERTGHHVN